MGCCTAKWKREIVVEHKFDYVNVEDFVEHGCGLNIKYLFQYLKAFKGAYFYISDIVALVLMYAFNITQQGSTGDEVIPEIKIKTTEVLKYLFPICVGFSFLILFVEMRKAYKVYKSRDISLAFTNEIVYRYLCFKNFAYFCFFEQINDMKTSKDQFALFLFFRLRGWKRLLLAEAPRAAIYSINLFYYYDKYRGTIFTKDPQTLNFSDFAILALSFTVLLFLIDLASMVFAYLLYIPFMMQIRGNLKEYCCHKIDKRIAILLRLNEEELMHEAARQQAQMGDATKNNLLSMGKVKNGPVLMPPQIQPANIPQQNIMPGYMRGYYNQSPYVQQSPRAPVPVSTGVYYDLREPRRQEEGLYQTRSPHNERARNMSVSTSPPANPYSGRSYPGQENIGLNSMPQMTREYSPSQSSPLRSNPHQPESPRG
ncbi:hypothetical protein MP638_006286 [Amoeboaphelidium occidentale]|nr:hypothetical protein MP638_006286 [Amoeboaphelidium occidentale]